MKDGGIFTSTNLDLEVSPNLILHMGILNRSRENALLFHANTQCLCVRATVVYVC